MCECRVLSGRGLCDGLITRPEESYRLCCVVVCDLETSRMGAPYIYDISRLRVKYMSHDSRLAFFLFVCTQQQFAFRCMVVYIAPKFAWHLFNSFFSFAVICQLKSPSPALVTVTVDMCSCGLATLFFFRLRLTELHCLQTKVFAVSANCRAWGPIRNIAANIQYFTVRVECRVVKPAIQPP